MEMTRQYLAGELSMLLAHLQAVANTEAARRDRVVPAARGRDGTDPGTGLGDRARAGTGRWPVLGLAKPRRHGGVHLPGGGLYELREFGVCAGLLDEA